MNIGIIGGGASGMILASKIKNHNVTIIDRNNKLGKKLLLTGNGKCNFTNLNFENINNIYNNDFAINVYNKNDNLSFIKYFESIGIVPKIEIHKNIKYVYPNSNKALSVYYCLLDKINSLGVKIILNSFVKEIGFKNNKFYVLTDNDTEYEFDKLVLATGGMSYSKTGSDGYGYTLAKKLGHNIIDTLPGLTSLKYYFKNNKNLSLKGKCRVNATIKYKSNDNIFKFCEFGEIQFNENIISGIPVLNLSNKIMRQLNNDLYFSLDFSNCLYNNFLNENKEVFCDLDYDKKIKFVYNYLTNIKKQTGYRTTRDFLCGFLPDEINDVILKLSNISNIQLKDLDDSCIIKLANNIVDLPFIVNRIPKFDNAQITLGGIDINEINKDTLESKIVKGLYFIGEIIDVDGICGGYNLQFAYSSASAVADSI